MEPNIQLTRTLEFIPLAWAILLTIGELHYKTSDTLYFDKVKSAAVPTIKTFTGQDLSDWPFLCVRRTIIRMGQAAFIELLILQIIINILLSYYTDSSRMMLSFIALSVPFAGAYFLTAMNEDHFNWYFPKKDVFTYTLQAWAGRLLVIAFIYIVIKKEIDIINLFSGYKGVELPIIFGLLFLGLFFIGMVSDSSNRKHVKNKLEELIKDNGPMSLIELSSSTKEKMEYLIEPLCELEKHSRVKIIPNKKLAKIKVDKTDITGVF